MAVCLSEEEDEVPPMPHDLRKPLPPPPPMPLPLPVQAAQPTQEPTKPSETEAQKQDPEKRDASPSPSPAAKEPAEEAVRKSPEPEPVRQKSPSQDSSQESEEEEEEARKPARQDMEITRTPTPPRHVLQAAQQASQAYRSPVQLQGPDEPTSPADCIRVELDEESEPTERPPKEEDQAPEPGPPAAPAGPAAEQPLKRPREPSEHLDFEAPALGLSPFAPSQAEAVTLSTSQHRSTGPAHAAALGAGAAGSHLCAPLNESAWIMKVLYSKLLRVCRLCPCCLRYETVR